MRKRLLSTTVFVLLIASLFGQNNTKQSSDLTKSFLNKKNQHSLSLEFAALSYTYVHQFKAKINIGLRVQAGMGLKLELKQHHYFEIMHSVDIIKLQLIYRLPLSSSLYFDIGPIAAIGYNGEDGEISYGVELSTYYSMKKAYIGARLESTYHLVNTSNKYAGIALIPIVLGINF